jgi:hypothetical protein
MNNIYIDNQSHRGNPNINIIPMIYIHQTIQHIFRVNIITIRNIDLIPLVFSRREGTYLNQI